MDLKTLEAWLITGSQSLYGPEVLEQVAADSRKLAAALSESERIPVKVVFKPVVTSPEGIETLCRESNAAETCIGLIAWMHTFSPAKMWIAGLSALDKPLVHLHTQFHRDLPWGEIDMDFMNLHQSAHGGREFGFMCTRLRRGRKIVVGHWQDPAVQDHLATWARAAAGVQDARGARIARFGDNMRGVAVTEGDKVEAQIRLGYAVDGFGIGDLTARMDDVTDKQIDKLLAEYEEQYAVGDELREGGEKRANLREAGAIELAMRAFLEDGGFVGFTTCFENLHGLGQLPGLACQRLMADGYGFGAEGDWKTAALVRAMKVMGAGLDGGCSFMEDYTYHLDPAGMKVLGAHMLEICESLADGPAELSVQPLSIGGKGDPARLIFDVPRGAGINATLVDMGTRFRMIANEVDVVGPDADLPNLPVARAVWAPRPDLPTSAAAWILAGGAHHMGFSMAVGTECLADYAEMLDVEFVLIDTETRLRELKKELRFNEVYYHLHRGLR